METALLIGSVVIFACILCGKISGKMGVPVLLLFIALGMLFGVDGIFGISFDDFKFSENVCGVALIFIMFYGGFGTNKNQAAPIVVKAAILSSVGVVITALLTGLFCYFVLRMDLLEGLLVGAVLSSTDAASVFSILRCQKLNLKYNTASLLEVESGSNDPFAYMLTIVILAVMNGDGMGTEVIFVLSAQVIFGVLFGIFTAFTAVWFLRKYKVRDSEVGTIFVFGTAIFAYAGAALIGGNGYLSVYITGIIMGNKKIYNKKQLVHFFDAFTMLMQMLIFFLLGLLATPSKIPEIIIPAVCIYLFISIVARPVAVGTVLIPFKSSFRQQFVVSWAGLRGAASIVFAIMAMVSPAYTANDLFHIVFCVVLLSVSIQGTLLPFISRKFNMTDENSNVLKTFTDYTEENEMQFIQLRVFEKSEWANKKVKDISIPPGTMLIMIIRNGKIIITKGNTCIHSGDNVVLCAVGYSDKKSIKLMEISVEGTHEWCNKPIKELDMSKDELILMVKRKGKMFIPKGKTVVLPDDILVVNSGTE